MSKFTKVQDVLKHKDNGLSVDEARKVMLEAGEAPRGIAGETNKNAKVGAVIPQPAAVAAAVAPAPVKPTVVPDFEDLLPDPDESVVTETKHVAPPPPPMPPAQPAAAASPDEQKPPKVERFENEKFTGEIKQEKGQWVAELQYKNGSGTERWVRGTKNELLIAVLEGKGNATLRVKEAVRRERLGAPALDKAYPLPSYVTAEKFEKMTPEEQSGLIDDIASRQVYAFMDLHPEYVKTVKNGEKLKEYLESKDLPFTVRNLEHAQEVLLEDGELETKSGKPVNIPAPKNSATTEPAQRVEDSTPAAPAAPAVPTVVPAPAPAAPLRKRGTSGLQPEQSSVPTGAGGGSEDGGKPRELSEAELRKLPTAELKRIADSDRRARGTVQR